MPTTPDPIESILGPDGRLARCLPDFEYRPSQIRMAKLIQDAIQQKRPSVIEAGTGTGKTLGYLVPLSISEKKCVISTGTKNLQEQIFFKDLPLLEKASGKKIDAILMKGRTNYLCLHRYRQYFSSPTLLRPDQNRVKKGIEEWLRMTDFADRAELSWLPDNDPLWEDLSSTSDQCLGTRCLHWDDCYLNELRRSATRSRLIIVNHHLFFADLKVKEGGFGEIIPRFQTIVFDEAHAIEEIATTYFGESFSNKQLLELATDLSKANHGLGRAKRRKIEGYLDFIRTGVEHLWDFFMSAPEKGRLDDETLKTIHRGPARNIRQGLEYIRDAPELKALEEPDLQAFMNRAKELNERFERVLTYEDSNWFNWYEKRKRSVILYASPLDVSEIMDQQLYQNIGSVIFTSATLSTNGNFDYFRSRLGIPSEAHDGICPSHFDFENQTLMYIPKDLPTPNDSMFTARITARISEIIVKTKGRALVLFTSYYNLNTVYQELVDATPYRIYKQGDAPKSLLLDRFRKETDSVLMATGSFWQGVDVPGESLSCLIIDKLPFDSPGDPLVAGRIESIRERRGNPFMEYQLPSAIISLKQGLGRLIRNASDRGILSILDTRILNSRYGRFFFDSLPNIPITHELSDIENFF